MINETKLGRLLEEFNSPRPEFDGESYVTRRREWFDRPMERIRPLLNRDRLSGLTVDDAQRIYKEMTVGGPQLYPRSFIENGIEKIRHSLDYLLYGEDPLETRFFNVVENVDGEHYLSGVGRALLLLHYYFTTINNSVSGTELSMVV